MFIAVAIVVVVVVVVAALHVDTSRVDVAGYHLSDPVGLHKELTTLAKAILVATQLRDKRVGSGNRRVGATGSKAFAGVVDKVLTSLRDKSGLAARGGAEGSGSRGTVPK